MSDEDIWHVVHYVQSMLQENDIARMTERRMAELAAHDSHGPSEGAHDDGHEAGQDDHGSESGH